MADEELYHKKYLKYKAKYIELKRMMGGDDKIKNENKPQSKPLNPLVKEYVPKRPIPPQKQTRQIRQLEQPARSPESIKKRILTIGEVIPNTLTRCAVPTECISTNQKIYSDHAMIHYKIDDIDVYTWNISNKISQQQFSTDSSCKPSYGHKFKMKFDQSRCSKDIPGYDMYDETAAEYLLRLQNIVNKIKEYAKKGAIILLQEAPECPRFDPPPDPNAPYNMFQKYIKDEGLQAVCYGSNYIIFDPSKHKHEPIQMALALTDDLAQRLRYPVATRLVRENKEYLFVSVHIGYISDGQNEKFKRTVDDFGQMIDNLSKIPSQISTGGPTIVIGGDFNRNAVFFAQLLVNHENSIFYTTTDKQTSFADNDGKYNVENVDLLFVKRQQTKTTADHSDTLRPVPRSMV